jgi:hypothetical protein
MFPQFSTLAFQQRSRGRLGLGVVEAGQVRRGLEVALVIVEIESVIGHWDGSAIEGERWSVSQPLMPWTHLVSDTVKLTQNAAARYVG